MCCCLLLSPSNSDSVITCTFPEYLDCIILGVFFKILKFTSTMQEFIPSGCSGWFKKMTMLLCILGARRGKINIKLIVTRHAKHFLDSAQIPAEVEVLDNASEWVWAERGDPVVHVELGKWADMFVIAPLDCRTLSVYANGGCDNLLTCAMMAWPLGEKPIVLCPGMNTKMWDHPATKENMRIVSSYPSVHIFGPIAKRLMCGDTGIGAMAEPKDVAVKVSEVLQTKEMPQTRPKSINALFWIMLTHVAYWWRMKLSNTP